MWELWYPTGRARVARNNELHSADTYADSAQRSDSPRFETVSAACTRTADHTAALAFAWPDELPRYLQEASNWASVVVAVYLCSAIDIQSRPLNKCQNF